MDVLTDAATHKDLVQPGSLKEQLAAVQLLLDTERKATEYDILLATCFERLFKGAASERELLTFVQACWPGAGITPFTLTSALEVGKAAALIRLTAGTSTWELTDLGVGDVEGSRRWADQILARAESAMADQATKAFGYVRPGECALWLSILLDALFCGVQRAFAIEGRQIELFGGRVVVPRIYDIDLISSRIDEHVERDDVAVFLRGMALHAIDPSHPFGSELIHHIATGYILQAFLARQDAPAARELVGSLLRGVAVLDTPVLVALMGHEERAFRIRQALASAISSGVRVVLLQETVVEMNQLLDRVGKVEAPGFQKDLVDGVDVDVLVALVRDDLIRSWLIAMRDQKVTTWSAFADRISPVLSTLDSMGVETLVDLSQVGRRRRYAKALVSELAKASRKRGDAQIQHDAGLLAFVASERSRIASSVTGPFIVTTDRYMTGAYRAVHGPQSKSDAPIALTLSEWAALVSATAEPGSVELLAQTTSSEVAHETIIALASRFPPSASRHLARVLSGADLSFADLALAPVSLDEVFRMQPALLELDPTVAAVEVASSIVALRAKRQEAAAELYRGFADNEKERAVVVAARADADKRLADMTIRDLEVDLATERQRSGELTRERDVQATRARRRPWVVVSAVLLLILGIVVWWNAWPFWGAGSIVSGALLWVQGESWARDQNRKISNLLAALAPELLVVFDVLSRV